MGEAEAPAGGGGAGIEGGGVVAAVAEGAACIRESEKRRVSAVGEFFGDVGGGGAIGGFAGEDGGGGEIAAGGDDGLEVGEADEVAGGFRLDVDGAAVRVEGGNEGGVRGQGAEEDREEMLRVHRGFGYFLSMELPELRVFLLINVIMMGE